MHVLKKQ